MEVGSYENIRLESKYKTESIEKIEIEKEINEHCIAKIKLLVKEEEISKLPLIVTEDENIKIIQKGEEEYILFSGVPKEVTVYHEEKEDNYYMEIEIISNTIKLDYELKSKSFQDKSNTYKNIFKEVIEKDCRGAFIDESSKGRIQDRTIIQYKESNWQFIKRIVTHIESYVIAETKGEVTRVWIGSPVGEEKEIKKLISSTSYKAVESYQKYVNNGGKNTESRYKGHKVKAYDVFELGEKVKFENGIFRVSKIKSKMVKGLLEHEYTLEDENALKSLMTYNEKIRGVTIKGKVLKVEKDKLKIHLEIDESQEESKANLYQLSSMYTSEGTTGWYCSPEVGATAYLYIPTEDEDKGFIRGIERLDGESNSKTSSPENKYFGNTAGKELKMDKEEIKWTSLKEKIYMLMNIKNGITIESDKDINIQSSSSIGIYGNKINIEGEEKIIFEVDSSSILMDNKTHIKGDLITEKQRLEEDDEDEEEIYIEE